jgi:secreted trypsin-like serine protease
MLFAALAAAPAAQAQTPAPRIVGGGPPSRAYPAQAAVFLDGSFECGGSLVAARYVATAAHCLTDASTGQPLAPGRLKVSVPGVVQRPATGDHAVAAVTADPDHARLPFSVGAQTLIGEDADLGVLRLAVALPNPPQPLIDPASSAQLAAVGQTSTVIGWGSTSEGGPLSPTLREVQVPILDDSACGGYAGAYRTATQLCAGVTAGGKDACSGDSGGPLLVGDGAGGLVLAGMVSYGLGCAEPGFPGVYSRITDDPLNAWLRAQLPRASLTAVPTDPEVGEQVVLTSTSVAPDGPFTTFDWDLDGDGAYDDATGRTARASFAAGSHGVALEASDPQGDRAVARATIVAAARTQVSVLPTSETDVREGVPATLLVRGTPPAGHTASGDATLRVTGGTAAASSDYLWSPTVFGMDGPGNEQPYELRTVQDSRDEPDETVAVALEDPTGALTLGEPSRVTFTIRDDDPPARPSVRVLTKNRLRVAVDGPGRLRARATTTTRTGATLARAARTLRRGRIATLRLIPTMAGRRALRSRSHVRARFVVSYLSPRRETSSRSVSGRLARPQRARI